MTEARMRKSRDRVSQKQQDLVMAVMSAAGYIADAMRASRIVRTVSMLERLVCTRGSYHGEDVHSNADHFARR